MCIHHENSLRNSYKQPLIYLLIIAFAIMSGLSNWSLIHQVGEEIANVFIRIFRLISLPLISVSLIVSITQYRAEARMQHIWGRTLLYTVSTTILAAFVAAILYIVIAPGIVVDSTIIQSTGDLGVGAHSYMHYITALVPDHLFAPFMEHKVMSALLISVLVGVAIHALPEQGPRDALVSFFQGIHGLFLVITGWIVTLLPIALFGFITTTIIQLKDGMEISGLGKYLLVVVFANLIQGGIVLPLFLKAKGVNPWTAFQKMLPALSVAFFSKSSAGTLPVTIAVSERSLQIDPQVSRSVLPLCTSINMNGCAAFIFATVTFVMHNHGIEPTLPQMLLWIFVSTLAAIGNAGVPMGCFFLSASLLSTMNIPMTLMGLILPFYSLIDMLETALNVWSDVCVAKAIDVELKEKPAWVALSPGTP